MTAAEVLTLPAAVDPETAFRVLGIGRTAGYKLIKAGKIPVAVLRLGGRSKICTADLIDLLGITRTASRP